MAFPYNEKLMVRILRDNIERYGYVSRNTAILFWGTDTIQKKVEFGIRYFVSLSKGNTNMYSSIDIKSEMYLILCDALASFSHEKNTCFSSYFNIAVNHRVQRIFQNDIIDNPLNVRSNSIESEFINKNGGVIGGRIDKLYKNYSVTHETQSLLYELTASNLFNNEEIEVAEKIISFPEKIKDLQGFDIDVFKKKLKIFFTKNKIVDMSIEEQSIYNYLEKYSFTSTAVKDEKGEVIVNTDGLCFAFDNLPDSDFAIKEGETYKITIEWVKTPTK